MKVVIPGGSGQIGQVLAQWFLQQQHEVVILSRQNLFRYGKHVVWDGKTLGSWADELQKSDVVINLAGRSVNCRYTEANLQEMLDSRVDSTKIVGVAIGQAKHPPSVWLQMSTATIYAHRFDAANDEDTGILGGNETDVPSYWARSIEIAKAWEQALHDADTPLTRKVALRSAMMMSPDKEGVFDVLLGLVRRGLGGRAGNGKQYVSWIHDRDFISAVEFLIEHQDLSGAFNLSSPEPLPNSEFMRVLRGAWGRTFGLPATPMMLELGAWLLQTDTELLLKSRRVVPTRLLSQGFRFQYPSWPEACRDLVSRWRAKTSAP